MYEIVVFVKITLYFCRVKHIKVEYEFNKSRRAVNGNHLEAQESVPERNLGRLSQPKACRDNGYNLAETYAEQRSGGI